MSDRATHARRSAPRRAHRGTCRTGEQLRAVRETVEAFRPRCLTDSAGPPSTACRTSFVQPSTLSRPHEPMPEKHPPRRPRATRSNAHTPAETPAATTSPRYLTVPEVAALLRTTKRAIYTRIDRGQLPGVVRLSRRILVDSQILEPWLDSQRDTRRPTTSRRPAPANSATLSPERRAVSLAPKGKQR